MDNITPKDSVETTALGIGKRITVAIGIVITAVSSLLCSVGGLDWITDNLTLFGTGVGALVTGGLTSYVAVRRMRIDRIATKTPLTLLLLLPVLMLTGCAVIAGKAGESRYSGFAFGEKASSTLAGLNITETSTDKGKIVTERGVGIDAAGSTGEADVSRILGNLLLIGLQSQGIPVKAVPASQTESPVFAGDTAAEESAASTEPDTAVAYSADGYGGSPGASGEGIYGRPSCSRCRAYKLAHPGVEIINLDDSSNRAAMWAALRARGYTGSSVALPCAIAADSVLQPAK